MAVNNSEYEIGIKTTAETSGAKQTEEALKETGKTAESTSEKLQDTGNKARQTGEKGEEGFKIFGRGAHEAHAALDALGQAFPGVGEMARFLMNPITAAIGGAIFIFGKFKEAIQETNKALDDLANSPGAQSEWIDKSKKAAMDADVAFEVWEDTLNRMADAAERLHRSIGDLIDHQNFGIQAAGQIAEANRAVETAKIDLAVKLGQITQEQAIKIKLQLDEAAFKQQAEMKIKEIEAEINARTREASQATDNTRGLGEKVNQTDAAARAADQAKIRNDGKLEQDKENLKRSQEELEKAQKTIEDLEGKGTWGGHYDPSDPQYYTLKAAKNTVESELKRQGMLRHSIQQEEEKQPGLDVAAQTSKAAAENARKQYEDSQKEMLEARSQIAKLQEDLQAEKTKAAKLEALHNQAAEIRAQGQEVDAARHLQESVQRGTATPAQIQQWLNQQQPSPPTAPTATPHGPMTLDSARDALTRLQMHYYTGHPPSEGEMQSLLNEFTALSRGVSGANTAQRAQVTQLIEAVKELRQEVEAHTQIINQTTNVR